MALLFDSFVTFQIAMGVLNSNHVTYIYYEGGLTDTDCMCSYGVWRSIDSWLWRSVMHIVITSTRYSTEAKWQVTIPSHVLQKIN